MQYEMTVKRDPVCGMEVSGTDTSLQYLHEGNVYSFCSAGCLQAFKKTPAGYSVTAEGGAGAARGKSILFGAAGGILLVVVFFGVVTAANGSFASAWAEFARIWYWVALLAGGFGLQLGLFVYLKKVVRSGMAGATAEVATSGTISTGSMIACCSHALANILPVLGVSAAAAFLARYQLPLILLGVFSNLIGLTIMLGMFQKHHLFAADAIMNRIDMKRARFVVIWAGMAAIGYSIYLAG